MFAPCNFCLACIRHVIGEPLGSTSGNHSVAISSPRACEKRQQPPHHFVSSQFSLVPRKQSDPCTADCQRRFLSLLSSARRNALLGARGTSEPLGCLCFRNPKLIYLQHASRPDDWSHHAITLTMCTSLNCHQGIGRHCNGSRK